MKPLRQRPVVRPEAAREADFVAAHERQSRSVALAAVGPAVVVRRQRGRQVEGDSRRGRGHAIFQLFQGSPVASGSPMWTLPLTAVHYEGEEQALQALEGAVPGQWGYLVQEQVAGRSSGSRWRVGGRAAVPCYSPTAAEI